MFRKRLLIAVSGIVLLFSLSFSIEAKEMVIDTLDNVNHWKLKTDQPYNMAKLSSSSEQVKEGNSSAKIEFNSFDNSWVAMRIKYDQTVKIEEVPNYIGMWVYVSPLSSKIFLSLQDATGEEFIFKLVHVFVGSGWQYKEIDIVEFFKVTNKDVFNHQGGNNDGKIDLPWTIKEIVIYPRKAEQGTIYFDQLKANVGQIAKAKIGEGMFQEDFESGALRGWKTKPYGGVTMTIISGGPGDSKYAYEVSYSGTSTDTAFALRSPLIPAKGGTAYLLRLQQQNNINMSKVTGGKSWQSGIIWYDSAGKEISRTEIAGFGSPDTTWHEQKVFALSPANATSAMVQLGADQPDLSGGHYWRVDNISFEKQ